MTILNQKKKKPEEILLTLREACMLLKCHPNTLRKWDKAGILVAIRFGTRRDRRYKKEDVLKLIENAVAIKNSGQNEGNDIPIENNNFRIEKLQESLKYSQDIIDTVREPFIVLDSDLRVVTANPAFYRTFKVLKKDTQEALIYRLGNNQWQIPKLRQLLESILPKHTTFKNFEVTHEFPTIGHKTMLLNARRIDSVDLILLAIEDITERKKLLEKVRESERYFRALIEKSADAIALVSPKGKVIYASPSTKNVLGYTEKELKSFSNPFEVVPADDKKLATKLFEKLLQKPYSTLTAEYRVKHKSGKHIWIESIMTNLLEDCDAKAIVLNYRNITRRKELETQKDDFIGIASHELKTPVTSIKAYTQILKKRFEKRGDEVATQSLSRMNTQINKLTKLIENLLDVTKVETGKIVFTYTSFDFDSLIRETVEDVQLTTEKHKIEVEGKTKKKVFADRERLGLVLVNLLTNAIKYSPHAVKITVHLSTDNKTITVGVQDFGIGIEKAKQDKVFQRFFKVSGPGNETYPGLGLGLYIADEIIKRHNGKMWLRSQVGKGSTFYFSIPIQGGKEKTSLKSGGEA